MKTKILFSLMLIALLSVGLASAAYAQGPGDVEVPFLEEWADSAHADATSESFTHWDEDDPAEVPTSCAKCHSTPGYLDFLGEDGSAAGEVDSAAEIGTVITCITCHNPSAQSMTSVVMPSDMELTGLGDEARCIQCHQGRESGVSVDEALEEAGVEEDTPSEELGFLNIHYYAAAATKYGTLAHGGYQYEGKTYDANFAHVDGYESCDECHSSHTLAVKVEECAECHTGVASVEDIRDIRMEGSLADYDGDGDVDEGMAAELAGLQEMLYQAMQAYAGEVAGTPLAYADAYPYYFVDSDGSGAAEEAEAVRENGYNAWTPRLLKATYNYQTSLKDPGAYAHGGKYIIQLLYDSIEDLNNQLSSPVDLSAANRNDPGHFAGSEEAFRHWDEDEPPRVEADCAKCHSAMGLPVYLRDEANVSEPIANGFQCATCHNDLTTFSYYEVAEVEFPSGAVVSSESPVTNLCMNCHQGRTSSQTVEKAVEGLDVDTPSEELQFENIHYFAAGATLYGSEVQGAYQYPDQEYVGRFAHAPGYTQCAECHSVHQLEVKVEGCGSCHSGVDSMEALSTIRSPMASDDYDGDGDTDEGAAGEIATMQEALYAAMQAYASDVVGTDLVYDSHSYPYFFVDTNGNGEPDEDEAQYANQYNAWTPRLLKAAYNYQYASKDPGAYAHNARYVMQALYDSLSDLGQQVTVEMDNMVRPE